MDEHTHYRIKNIELKTMTVCINRHEFLAMLVTFVQTETYIKN